MKNMRLTWVALICSLALMNGCRSKADEKKIAELEKEKDAC